MSKPHLFTLLKRCQVLLLLPKYLLKITKRLVFFMFRFSPKQRFLLSFCLVLLVFSGIFLVVQPTQAGPVEETVGLIVNLILSPIVSWLGKLLMLLMDILVRVASFNNFIHFEAVRSAWAMVRDVCNMFFIIFLMLIAFGTIMNIQEYSYRNTLTRLILMAVLINFSLMICGLFIDFAQVVMMTFVNGIRYVAAGNITAALGLDAILRYHSSASPSGMDLAQVMVTLLLGLALMTIATVIIVVLIMQLVMRIVFIWMYVVLSPLAYAANIIPPTKKYAQQWWGDFTNYLVQGPVVVFFLWFALFVASSQGGDLSVKFKAVEAEPNNSVLVQGAVAAEDTEGGDPPEEEDGGNELLACPGEICSTDRILSFVLGIGMLIGAVVMSKKLGGAGGSIVSKAYGKAQAAGAKPFKKVGRGVAKVGRGAGAVAKLPWTGTKALGKYGGRKAKEGVVAGAKAGWARVPGVGTDAKARRKEIREEKRARKKEKETLIAGEMRPRIRWVKKGARQPKRSIPKKARKLPKIMLIGQKLKAGTKKGYWMTPKIKKNYLVLKCF